MTINRFFDDEETGLSPQTSHPNFRALATAEFYFDGCDDFSPFGNDDGADTLSALEAWFMDGGTDEEIPSFLDELLATWDLDVPEDIISADLGDRQAWLDGHEMREVYLAGVCRARVATAFGQLKITGEIHPWIRGQASEAIACQLWLNQRARHTNPQWRFADLEKERLLQMQGVLLSTRPGPSA